MTDAVRVIRAEIAKRENEIIGLKKALEILDQPTQSGADKVKAMLALPPAAKKQVRKGRGEHMLVGTYTVNGVDLHLGTVQFNILETLDKAEDCVQREKLEPFCNGDRKALHQAIFQLKAKLKPAGATIEFFPGEGYRLQNIEDS